MIKLSVCMLKQSFVRALIAGMVFALLQWLGDKYLFDLVRQWYVYAVEFVIFVVMMTGVYYYFYKRDSKKQK